MLLFEEMHMQTVVVVEGTWVVLSEDEREQIC
jgi:hypothetical protein